MKAKVNGLGGIFLKFKNPDAMRTWYSDVLGMTTNDYGVLFAFNGSQEQTGYLQLGTFPENTDYFGSTTQQYMINFRVSDLELFVEQLKQAQVKIVDDLEEYDYGKFIHIEDPEGNRIELWEPVDEVFSSEPHMNMK